MGGLSQQFIATRTVVRFHRRRIEPQPLATLRFVGARDGWLIETSDVIRVGFGEAVDHVVLDQGLDVAFDATAVASPTRLAG